MIIVAPTTIDPAALFATFTRKAQGAGAIVSFAGIVRGSNGVDAIELDHSPGLTEKEIARAADEARSRFALIDVTIAHRVGRVAAGEPIVFVATAAKHRREAFDACDFLMDFLKCDAPFWKKEIAGGKSRWIEPRAEDYRDRER